MDVSDIPKIIEAKTPAVFKKLKDGSIAVKLALEGQRRYGVYKTELGEWTYTGELLTLEEAAAR